jgi:DNA processing protein
MSGTSSAAVDTLDTGGPTARTPADPPGADERAWISLAAVTGVGDVTFARLLARYGTATQVLELAAMGRLPASREVAKRTIDAIATTAAAPERVHERLAELGVWALTPFAPDYPARLATLEDPPPVIYGRGDVAALWTHRAVAVVGTRRPTLAARSLTARVAVRLVECHATVVSGLAFGIDGVGHAATLDAGGVTVAVLGGGHAHVSPRAHRSLADRIAASGGAVVCESPPDTGPTKGTFPRRNRIISALSDAVLVMEAPSRSGALITARLALEAGLPVLAAPGRPGDPAVAGCLDLLRTTPARPLVGMDELVIDLGFGDAGASSSTGRTTMDRSTAIALLGPAEAAVAGAIADGGSSPDLVVARTGLAPAVVAVATTLLQLRGWVRAFGPSLLPAGPLLVEARAEPAPADRAPGGGVSSA